MSAIEQGEHNPAMPARRAELPRQPLLSLSLHLKGRPGRIYFWRGSDENQRGAKQPVNEETWF